VEPDDIGDKSPCRRTRMPLGELRRRLEQMIYSISAHVRRGEPRRERQRVRQGRNVTGTASVDRRGPLCQAEVGHKGMKFLN
jgi:hypothetical protein